MSYHLQRPLLTFLSELLQRRRQALSFLLYRLKWNLYPRFHYVSSFPLHIDIEVTNKCNLRCTMCVQQSEEGRKNQGEIDFDMVCRILESIGGRVYSLKFNWRGEPLLYRRLPELIAKAKDSGISEIQINTNGLLLTKKLSRNLIEAGLDRIIFSIDGHSPETYEKIRVGGSYRVLLDNVHGFLKERKLQNTSFPIVRVQMCVGEDNIQEKENFIKHWLSFGTQVGIIGKQDRTHRVDLESCKIKKVVCKQPWQRLTISWDGRVFSCCGDHWEKSPLWKITTEMSVQEIRDGLEDIWIKSSIINNIRKAIVVRDVKNVLCSHCPSIRS